MSNAIRYDALLVRDLARELHARLCGVRLQAVLFDRDQARVALLTRAARRADPEPPSILWQLHPDAGHVTAVDAATATGARGPLPAQTGVVRVSAPPDERLIELELAASDAAAGAARRIIIELMTNQWNALALGADDRIVAVLRERQTRARTLRNGEPYVRPAPSARRWATDRPTASEWAAVLRAEPPGRRLSALLRAVAYTSPLNAAAILGDADVVDTADALERARDRYLRIVHDAPRAAHLIVSAGHPQPYSVPLTDASETQPTLLDAFMRAAELAAAVPVAPAATDVALAAVAERVAQTEQRMRRLAAERSGAEEEARQLRRQGDLLLSQLARVRRGAASVELDDFSGGTTIVTLDPTLNAADNATRLYDVARKRARAAARIPALLEAGERELARLHGLAERIRDGTAADEEVARLLRRHTAAGGRDAAPVLPYRSYRTSGGHEVRVGRGARANDELTFRHSSATDIWLHARDVGGAHVILRWSRADGNPPARDIAEAANLAALHSRARTSGTVAVDWTRRKYVRKPRKAGPGVVIPERVRTVFVAPDANLEQRLRDF